MSQIILKKPKIGIPHFSGKAKQIRAGGYNLRKCINDITDNPVGKATELNLNVQFNDINKPLQFKFSDNYENGFENLDKDGSENPLNMAHVCDGHSNNDETSEFGIGLKAAAINMGEKLSIYTYSKEVNKYLHIEFDFNKMREEKDANNSYEHTLFVEINKEEFRCYHPYSFGSTIIIDNIREEMITDKSKKDFLEDIKKNLSDTYDRVDIKLSVNDEEISKPLDVFELDECKPFNIERILHYNTKTGKFIIEYNDKYYEFGNDKLPQMKNELALKELKENKSHIEKIHFKSTFTYFITQDKNERQKYITDGNIKLYRSGRLYGDIHIKRNDGIHNYTHHECTYESKKLNNQFGLTYSKEIPLDKENEFNRCIDKIRKKQEQEFNANTSTQKFKNLEKKAIESGFWIKEDGNTFSSSSSDEEPKQKSKEKKRKEKKRDNGIDNIMNKIQEQKQKEQKQKEEQVEVKVEEEIFKVEEEIVKVEEEQEEQVEVKVEEEIFKVEEGEKEKQEEQDQEEQDQEEQDQYQEEEVEVKVEEEIVKIKNEMFNFISNMKTLDEVKSAFVKLTS